MDSESQQIQQSLPRKDLLPTAGVSQELPFDSKIPEQNVDAVQTNSDIHQPLSNGVNGTSHLSTSDQIPPALIPAMEQPILPPTTTETTTLAEPITSGELLPPPVPTESDPAQHEESDLRHSASLEIPPVTTSVATPQPLPEQVATPQPPETPAKPVAPAVNEAPAPESVPAPAAPIDALLAPEVPPTPTPVPTESAPIAPVDTAMSDAPVEPASIPAEPIAPVVQDPVTYPNLPADDIMDVDVPAPSVEPTLDQVKSETSQPTLEVKTDLPSQPKPSRPRDEDEADGPETKRLKTEDSNPIGTSAIVDTPIAMETPILPPPPKATSRPSSRAGSRAGSRSQRSTPAPQSATSSQPQKIVVGNLPVPEDRVFSEELDGPITPAQKKHLQRGIQNARKGNHAGPFSAPVDPVLLNIPTYFDIIKKPMDLKTVDTLLKNNEYPSVNAFLADIDTMVANSIRFNGPDHAVSQHGIHLRHAFDRNIASLPGANFVEPNASEKKAKKMAENPPKRRESRIVPSPSAGSARSPTANQTFALKSDGVPLIRRDSTVQDGRPRREIHPPASKDLPYSSMKPKRKKFITELKFCEKVYDELSKPKYSNVSWPFQLPVDPVALNIPQYLKIIKKPMDMSTIGNKLKNGEYENAKEFEEDFRLMINNCLKFNPEDHPINAHGKDYLSYFEQEWKNKNKWVKEHTPRSAEESPEDSDEEDDEEEEDDEDEEDGAEDEKAQQISQLQASLAAIQNQLAGLQQGTSKPSKPASEKKKKTKSVKKEIKKDSKPAVKSSKKAGAKKEKTKTISYEDKMSLSERINDLNADDMSKVMQIIQKGMPSIGNNEDEVELDIDELPANVLYNLHVFVQGKSAGHKTAKASSGNHAAIASSKPKKNRPMKKEEQEAKIRDLQSQLARVSSGAGFEAASPGGSSEPAENDESSGDDSDEESEED